MQVTDVLAAMETAVRDAAERTGPSVAGIGRGWGRGSGIVVADGRVLTNAHVLRGEDSAVTFADGRVEHGRVIGGDADHDIAVLAVDTGDAPVIPWGGEPRIGMAVLALADPGGRGLRVTCGQVSATDRSFRGPRGRIVRGSIEHTAPMPRGASGGPLVDAQGSLIGINTVRLEGGFILALAADAALRARIDAIGRGEARAGRPRLGLALASPRTARKLRAAVGLPERDGLLVRGVADGGPADKAGLQRGDLLVRAGDREIATVDDLLDVLATAGAVLELVVVRGVEQRTVTLAPHFSS